jgi:cystathionine beta-synthase
MGKMFNDDWMRDRGFLVTGAQTKAINLIEGHKHLKLVTISNDTLVDDAVKLMRKYDISQVPVTDASGAYVGALNSTTLFNNLVEDHELKHKKVSEVMSAPFPFVRTDATLEEVSKLINKENAAVLV